MPKSYHRLQPTPKTVPEFKDVLQLIWSALREKAIDNAIRLRQVTADMCQIMVDILST